jgi:hypothetical protein
MIEKKRENEYRVCVVGTGIIRCKGISAPYKGTLFESDLIKVFAENRSVNIFKYDEDNDEYISGHLFSYTDFLSSGRSIEKMIENAGYKHDYPRRCILKVETLGDIEPKDPIITKTEEDIEPKEPVITKTEEDIEAEKQASTEKKVNQQGNRGQNKNQQKRN